MVAKAREHLAIFMVLLRDLAVLAAALLCLILLLSSSGSGADCPGAGAALLQCRSLVKTAAAVIIFAAEISGGCQKSGGFYGMCFCFLLQVEAAATAAIPTLSFSAVGGRPRSRAAAATADTAYLAVAVICFPFAAIGFAVKGCGVEVEGGRCTQCHGATALAKLKGAKGLAGIGRLC